jgi:hypothetical protein
MQWHLNIWKVPNFFQAYSTKKPADFGRLTVYIFVAIILLEKLLLACEWQIQSLL